MKAFLMIEGGQQYVEFLLLPPWTPTLFYVLTLISVGVFSYGVYRRLQGYAPPSLRSFFSAFKAKDSSLKEAFLDVFLQRRVVNEGYGALVHLPMFYSMLILGLSTLTIALDHYLVTPILRVKLLAGTFLTLFKAINDVFGGGLLIFGVLVAMWRRLFLKPKYLESKAEDYVILLLIMICALSGFMVRGVRIAVLNPSWSSWTPIGSFFAYLCVSLRLAEPNVHVALWWFHAVIALTLIAATPYTKLWHLIITPFNAYLNGKRVLGELPTPFNLKALLEGGVEGLKVGYGEVKDVPWDKRLMMDCCMNCGRCDRRCPAAESGRQLLPSGFIRRIRSKVVEGLKAKASFKIVDDAVGEDEVWSCTTCGACLYACPVRINHVDLIVELRRWLIASGKVDVKKQSLLQNLAYSNNSLGLPQADRHRWLSELNVRSLDEAPNSDYVLWLGCLASYDGRIRLVVQSLAALLEKAGVKVATLRSNETCCGDPARRLGEEGRFQEFVLTNTELFTKYNVKNLLVLCPHCYNTFKNEYPSFGVRLQVIHHSELLDNLIKTGRLKLNQRTGIITIHDPCYLSRYNAATRPYRSVLSLGLKMRIIEPERTKHETFCCGAGGANYWYDVPERERISVLRLRELVKTGANLIATQCPFCLLMLSDALKIEGLEGKVEVKDIAEIVFEAL
ncbi:MAG: heterodisulfide reductase-related iron-sulfur binding cluster [Candidatus Nezhaarchaeales archaeon]